ncbi:hypothetical protein [Uniformispora flossi]|uniref:hypothetical protein n=1 Tax=Uniformispora flossi TaxID=3390723 RepID=UPI003D07DA86
MHGVAVAEFGGAGQRFEEFGGEHADLLLVRVPTQGKTFGRASSSDGTRPGG